jgi:hypothetical protein
MTNAEWQQLYESLKKTLAPNDIYWTIWESWKDGEPLHGSLADDIADIYRDLKDGSGENEVRDKVWEWRFSFYSHWGKHAAGALRSIHDLIADIGV